MSFKPAAQQPDFSPLQTVLVNSRLQTKDNALYQVIQQLIAKISQFQSLSVSDINNNTVNVNKITGDISSVTNDVHNNTVNIASVKDQSFITAANDTTTLPNSRRLAAGTNVTLDTTVPGVITVNATTGTTSGTVTTTGTINTGSLTVFGTLTNQITSGALTGDVTTGTTLIATLATTGVTAGSYGSSTQVPVISIDAKGRVTTAANTTISGGSAGALVLLEQHTAVASTSLDCVSAFTTTYDDYLIELINLIPATGTVSMYLRASIDGGATFVTTGLYSFSQFLAGSGGFSAAGGAVSTTQFNIGGTITASQLNGGISGTIKITNPLGGASYTRIASDCGFRASNDSQWYKWLGEGVFQTLTPVNAIRVFTSTGNITSGTIRVYGIAKS